MPSQTVFSKDIFHGLPDFPAHDGNSYTAIVAGANGIGGASIVRAVTESPQRWKNVYALSRRPRQSPLPAHVEHISVDLLQDPSEIAQALMSKGVKE
jgi:hypothetical protein